MTTALVPVVVKNTLPAEIVALTPEAMLMAAELIEAATAISVTDAATLEAGNEIYRKIDALYKGISTSRLEITRPIDALKKAIMDAEREATKPLEAAKKSLGERIVACQKELQRIREEAERKARAEAEEKARAERERLEAERQAKLREAEEKRKADEEKARQEAEMFGGDPEAAVAELPPVEVPPAVVVVPVVETTSLPPELPKAAVRTTTRMVLEVFDDALVPVEHAGVLLRPVDAKAVTGLLKVGVKIPGCRLVPSEGIASAGGRK